MQTEMGEGYMKIPITLDDGDHLMIVRFDVADTGLVSQFEWHLRLDYRTFYAGASVPVTRIRPIDRSLYVTMHRLLLGPPGRIGHLNGNGLDNRRANLVRQTQAEILAKRRPSGGASQYKGVAWDKGPGRWVARFRGKNLGRFQSEEAAARAFDAAAYAYWGVLAYLNFPRETDHDREPTREAEA